MNTQTQSPLVQSQPLQRLDQEPASQFGQRVLILLLQDPMLIYQATEPALELAQAALRLAMAPRMIDPVVLDRLVALDREVGSAIRRRKLETEQALALVGQLDTPGAPVNGQDGPGGPGGYAVKRIMPQPKHPSPMGRLELPVAPVFSSVADEL